MFFGTLEFWDFVWISVIVAIAVSAVALRLRAEARARLSRLEAKIDRLLKDEGVAHDGGAKDLPADVPAGVLEALGRGNKIEAIKRYRAATGVDLAEAKNFVEALAHRA
ncbi:MAG: ribosomal protein L7/L12 [Candidatus Binatia bacterium]